MMESQEFTDTVRRELAGAALAGPAPGDAARMARRVLQTRARRRQRTLVGGAAAAVVLALGAAAVVTTTAGGGAPEQIQTAAAVTQWPARGPLAGDTGLIERARQAWTQALPAATSSGMTPSVLFAGTTAAGASLSATVVVLRSQDGDGGTHLAFMTGPLTPPAAAVAPAQAVLQVRAQMDVPAGQLTAPAYGFVASVPAPGDAAAAAPVSVGVAVTAPGVDTAWFTTSAVDAEMSDTSSHPVDGLLSAMLPNTAAAWNTLIATGNARTPVFGALASSSHDPAISAVSVVRAGTDAQFAVSGTDAKPGDVVVAPAGFVGLVTAVRDGLTILDSNPGSLPGTSGLRTVTAVTGNPVTLAGGGTHVGDPVTVTAAPGVLREGNRIVLTGFGASAGLVNLGTVQPAAGGTWRLQPSVATPPDGAVVVLIHR